MVTAKLAKRAKNKRTYSLWGKISDSFKRFGSQKFTIMLVPHSEKKTVNLHISQSALCFIIVLLIALLAGSFWFSLNLSSKEALLATVSRDLAETEASLDIIREEVGGLVTSAERFRTSLSQTMGILGFTEVANSPAATGNGDLSSLFAIQQSSGNTIAEVQDLQALQDSLNDSAVSLEDISLILANQKELLSDIPTIWPLKEVRGWVTQIFGPSINPFGKYWYLHRGIDLAFGYGVPIMATADGKVVKKDFDENGFGYYLDIQHNYGFKTRYAHLQRQMVEVGQKVSQGEIIGTMGNSGLSTGPHLHYEVMLGTQLVDPLKFLNMKTSETPSDNFTANLKKYQ